MAKCAACNEYKAITSCTVNTLGNHHSVDDAPAIVWDDGEGWWYLNGDKHRVGRPAIELTKSNYYKWYLYGVLHRMDGPAIRAVWCDVKHSWFYKGLQVSITIFNQEIIVGRSVTIEEDVATVIRHVEGCFYEVLWGNKKVLIAKV